MQAPPHLGTCAEAASREIQKRRFNDWYWYIYKNHSINVSYDHMYLAFH